jgi:AraC-like DNA-binding protein
MKFLFNFSHSYKSIVKRFKNLDMTKPESIEDYYASRPFLTAENLSREVGHFNVFRIEEQRPDEASPVAYGRKDFFKICLTTGKSRIHYADKSMEIMQHGLLFANPLIPYNWEPLEAKQTGYTCIFTEPFFNNYGRLKDYPVFKPGGLPVYELNGGEFKQIGGIFGQMVEEKDSSFEFRDDVLRNLVFQLIHSTLKMRPATHLVTEKANGAARITSLFIELLEKQFPVKNTIDGLELRSASDFARQLALHVNHLNKSVKEVTQKTTSEVIMERLLKEAKIMLKHSTWTISEIAYSLGFEEPTHFSSFFRKHLQLSPSQFRNA